jgi:peptidoglycan/LPS O-acetylase OafA/YrhL
LEWARRAVSALNARAVTIYLWHFPCVFIAREIARRLGNPLWTPRLPVLLLVVCLLIPVAMAVGWVEDLSAHRTPQLIPSRSFH